MSGGSLACLQFVRRRRGRSLFGPWPEEREKSEVRGVKSEERNGPMERTFKLILSYKSQTTNKAKSKAKRVRLLI